MPTIILVDTSLAMAVPFTDLEDDEDEVFDRRHLIVKSVSTVLAHISKMMKIEFVSLVLFNSEIDVKIDFTRDYSLIKDACEEIEFDSIADVPLAINETIKDFELQWGELIPYQIIFITNTLYPKCLDNKLRLPHNNKLITLLMEVHNPSLCELEGEMPDGESSQQENRTQFFYQIPDKVLFDLSSVENIVIDMCQKFLTPFSATLKCGNFTSSISLMPTPNDYDKVKDFEHSRFTMPDHIDIFGFLQLNDISNPPFISRHLILPDPKDGASGDTPAFTVMLHGALKIQSYVALVQLQENWFAMIFSWADTKKKSNLILSICEPGSDRLPWLGNLNKLSIQSDFATSPYRSEGNAISPFPVKPSNRHSYSLNYVVWIRAAGIQTDIQKILRNARKLPDKLSNFYKESKIRNYTQQTDRIRDKTLMTRAIKEELNRLRRAIISYSFYELFEMLAKLIEREMGNLPSNSHPHAAKHLAYSIDMLRHPNSREYNNNITHLKI